MSVCSLSQSQSNFLLWAFVIFNKRRTNNKLLLHLWFS